MTNDERNPKPECRKTLSGVFAGFVIRILSFLRISSFVIGHSSFGFVRSGSWKVPFRFCACIGTILGRRNSGAGVSHALPNTRAGRPCHYPPHPRLYNLEFAPRLPSMNSDNPVVLAAIGLIVLVALAGFAAHFLSPDAKLERRRRRNNYRVISKAKGPAVRLNARGKK